MSRRLCVVLCGFLTSLSWAGGAEPPVVGDPTGAFRKNLEGVWTQGDPKAPDRVELEFTWQKMGGGQDWVRHPAIALTTYRKGEVVQHVYGPVFLEKSGKKVLKWGNRLYEYRFKDKTIRLKECTAPFQFDDGVEEKPSDRDALAGEWTKQANPPKEAENGPFPH
jgi:hypothetical protein